MKKLFFTIICLGLFPLSAHATVIDAHSASLLGLINGVGKGRGQGIQVNSDFSVSSIGIFGDLVSQSFDLVIYSSIDGHTAGSVLTSASGITGGTGLGWNDIALNFNFIAGNSYVVNWRSSDGNSSWGTIETYWNSVLPVTVGPLTLVDGFSKIITLNSRNTLHPRLRYVTSASVPEPGLLGLLALGLAGFGMLRRKRR